MPPRKTKDNDRAVGLLAPPITMLPLLLPSRKPKDNDNVPMSASTSNDGEDGMNENPLALRLIVPTAVVFPSLDGAVIVVVDGAV